MNLNKKTLIKLFVMTVLSMTLVSCGQPIEGSKNSQDDSNLTPELSANIVLSMELTDHTDSESSPSSSYLFENTASVTIPAGVYLKSGTPDSYLVNLVFNASESRDHGIDINEFYCQYESIKEIKGYVHIFRGCFQDVDNDGIVEDLGYNIGQKVIQDKWNYIRFDRVSGQNIENASVWTELETHEFKL